MSYCSRKFLFVVCILQFVATLEWQVFNFLGYMWTQILVCFLHFIFIMIGFFGALQYRPRCAVVFIIWLILWIGINVFIVCIYLDVGVLRKDSHILNLGLGNKSWWFDHGVGCRVNATDYSAVRSPTSVIPAENQVSGCLLAYPYVEVIHAGVQIILAILGIIASICLTYVLRNEEDTFSYIGNFGGARTSAPSTWGTTIEPLYFTLPSSASAKRRTLSLRKGGDLVATPTSLTAPSTPAQSRSLGVSVGQLSVNSAGRSSVSNQLEMQAQPVKSSEMEYINMRRPLSNKPTPLMLSSPSPSQAGLNSSQRRPHDSPHEFDTLVTEVDTLSPHPSRESLNQPPPQRLSANRLLRDAETPERKSGRRQRQRSRRALSREKQSIISSYLGSGEGSVDRREPLPWVVASPVRRQDSGRSSEAVPPYQPPPYSPKPPSPALYVPPAPAQDPHDPWRRPQDERPPRNNSPYENWPMPVPVSRNRYENAWSPVPPSVTPQPPPSTASMTPSTRTGVIFFRSTGGGDGESMGLSLGGSVMV